MRERENQAYATNWVSKNDLYTARPDLHYEIDNLDESDMEAIAKGVGDAMAETHDLAIENFLTDYLSLLSSDSNSDKADQLPTSTAEQPLHRRLPDTPKPAIEYNSWKGNGDSLASAQLT